MTAVADPSAPTTLALTPDEAVQTALQWHQEGKLEQARLLYKHVTTIAPDHAAAWHFLGLLHYQLGAHETGIDHIRQSLQLAPDYADAWNNLGNMMCEQGDFDQAATAYRKALAHAPERVDIANNLGHALKHQGHTEDAERLWRENLTRSPQDPFAYDHLGQLCRARGELDQAQRLLETATRLNPKFAVAFRHLGQVLAARNQHEASAHAFARAVELGANAYLELAHALREQGLIDAAIGAYRKALDIGTRSSKVYYHLVMLLNARERREEALDLCRIWLEAEPENSVAHHMMAAIGGAPCPERASDAYVQSVFDGFASSFEQRLQQLRYQAPELVVDLLLRAVSLPALVVHDTKQSSAEIPRFERLLDAGCGTGLCAPGLRAHTQQLIGVDLSIGMLKQAATKRLYDQLIEGELTHFLAQTELAFDAIVSADTLVYFGDLSGFLAAAARALKSGGLLVATLEKDENASPPGYRLHGHGRYAHASDYLKDQLRSAGFTLVALETAVLRREMGEDVAGLLFCAKMPVSLSDDVNHVDHVRSGTSGHPI